MFFLFFCLHSIVGDAFVRELEFSKVTIRLREHGKDLDEERDDVLAKLTGNTLETLRQCLVSSFYERFHHREPG